MYGDVNIVVEDGNLGRSPGTGTGTQIKIGVSHVTSNIPLLITGTMNHKKIREKLGNTPLADSCMDSVEWGAQTIYCLPVQADVEGSIGSMTHTGTGAGTIQVTGTPHNTYHIRIEIRESGGKNAGAWRYSLDHGNTYSDDRVIPLSGTYEIEDTGLTVTFAETEDGAGFVEGDSYELATSAPAMSNQAVIQAVESLINSTLSFEYVHIVGVTSKALWASLASMADDFLTKYKRPLFFVCEARNKNVEESLEEYKEAMRSECKGITSQFLQVVCSWSKYQRMDGRVMDINNAGIITGLYGQTERESQSIGEVRSFPISCAKILKLLPDGVEDIIPELDAAKYVTLRQYIGKEDYYVTNANMMAADNSDYPYAEHVRVLCRLVKAIRQQALEALQVEIDPVDPETSVIPIQEELNIPIEDAIRDGIISDGAVVINIDRLNILVDESLDVTITYINKGYAREINLTFGVSNPYQGE